MVRDLDPAVERVILRSSITTRPPSRFGVACRAALPGGDPIAAALAAGETPSPEMVARRRPHRVQPRIGLSRSASSSPSGGGGAVGPPMLIARIPLDKSVDVLEGRARDILEKLGHTERPADTARGYFMLQDFIFYTLRTDQSPARWNALSNG
jgi:serine/threonine-protein kinase